MKTISQVSIFLYLLFEANFCLCNIAYIDKSYIDKYSDCETPNSLLAFTVSLRVESPIKCKGEKGIINLSFNVTPPSPNPVNVAYIWSGGSFHQTPNRRLVSTGTYTVTVTSANYTPRTATINISEPTEVQINNTRATHYCPGSSLKGEISIRPTGGTPPYRFQVLNHLGTILLNQTTIINNGEMKIQYLNSGEYMLKLLDWNSCQDIEYDREVFAASRNFTDAGLVKTDVTCFQNKDGEIISTPEQIFPLFTSKFDFVLSISG